MFAYIISIVIKNSSLFCPPEVRETKDFETLQAYLVNSPLMFADFVRLKCVCKDLQKYMEGVKYMMFSLTQSDWKVYSNVLICSAFHCNPYGSNLELTVMERTLQIFGYMHNSMTFTLNSMDGLLLLFRYGALDHIEKDELNNVINLCLSSEHSDCVEYLVVHGYLRSDYICKRTGWSVLDYCYNCYTPTVPKVLAEYKFPIPETDHTLYECVPSTVEEYVDFLFQLQMSDEFLLRIHDYAFTHRDNMEYLLTKSTREIQDRGIPIPAYVYQ